jgi:hypothetical protein
MLHFLDSPLHPRYCAGPAAVLYVRQYTNSQEVNRDEQISQVDSNKKLGYSLVALRKLERISKVNTMYTPISNVVVTKMFRETVLAAAMILCLH